MDYPTMLESLAWNLTLSLDAWREGEEQAWERVCSDHDALYAYLGNTMPMVFAEHDPFRAVAHLN